MGSLRIRVLTWVSALLILIYVLTIVGLDWAFRQNTERALRDRMETELLGLISLAQPDAESGLALPIDLGQPRFNLPGSGLYGALWNSDERLIWRSWSLLDRELDFGQLPSQDGSFAFKQLETPTGAPLRGAVMAVTWDTGQRYWFGVAEDWQPYLDRQRAFQFTLIGWFAIATVVTVSVLALLLHWVWTPLRRLRQEITEIQEGRRSRLGGQYPLELTDLAGSLDTLVSTERRRQTRYRNMLDNLAHSLKTPLAVMRSLLAENRAEANEAGLQAEVGRMEDRVLHHLEQARRSGGVAFSVTPEAVAPLLEDLRSGLAKVYRDKGVAASVAVDDGCQVAVDKGDLLEILGNLFDNAYKYCAAKVAVAARSEAGSAILVFEDDGPGLKEGEAALLTARGTRADESKPGHGIGLAMVAELIANYRGSLSFGRSELGGSRIEVTLPAG